MALLDPPTKKQVGFLRKVKIKAPKTKRQCSLLIDYLLEGRQSPKRESVGDRIRRIRDYWLGAEVKLLNQPSHQTGRVVGIRIRSVAQVAAIGRKARGTPGPLVLVVEVGTHRLEVSPSKLSVLTRGNQKQLF